MVKNILTPTRKLRRLNQIKESSKQKYYVIQKFKWKIMIKVLKYLTFTEFLTFRAVSLGGFELCSNRLCLSRIRAPRLKLKRKLISKLITSQKLSNSAKIARLKILFELTRVQLFGLLSFECSKMQIGQYGIEVLSESLKHLVGVTQINLGTYIYIYIYIVEKNAIVKEGSLLLVNNMGFLSELTYLNLSINVKICYI